MSTLHHSNEAREREEALVEAIVRYVDEHPNATDTLAGIAEWWVMRQRVRIDLVDLARAVDRCVSVGLLEEVGAGDSRMYRKKPTESA